jgi:hypothetical protein
MSSSTTGLLAGLFLALIGATGGLGWLLVGLVLGAVGFLVGAHLEGRVDLSALVPGRNRG